MNEQEIRSLVREAIARHIGAAPGVSVHVAPVHGAAAHSALVHPAPLHHFSHSQFVVPSGSDAEGPCIIEPSVMCNHCGYCKSYGH
jgi:hypothetical protein